MHESTEGKTGTEINAGLDAQLFPEQAFLLLGLAALGLIALAPSEPKADDGFRVYVNPGYQQDGPYYYDQDGYRHYRHADEYGWHSWHRDHHRHHYDRDYDRD
jgi:hypothetical protein